MFQCLPQLSVSKLATTTAIHKSPKICWSSSCVCCILYLQFTARVKNVVIEVVNTETVLVSWSPVTLQETSGYIIFYSDESSTQQVNVSDPEASFAVIFGLTAGVEYQFQMQAVVEIDGEVFLGKKSNTKLASGSE